MLMYHAKPYSSAQIYDTAHKSSRDVGALLKQPVAGRAGVSAAHHMVVLFVQECCIGNAAIRSAPCPCLRAVSLLWYSPSTCTTLTALQTHKTRAYDACVPNAYVPAIKDGVVMLQRAKGVCAQEIDNISGQSCAFAYTGCAEP